jgi:hypothetical protein
VFGESTTDPTETAWLAELRSYAYRSNDQWGEKVAENLENDSNVPEPRSERFRQGVRDAGPPASPADPRQVFETVLDALNRKGLTFDSTENAPCLVSLSPDLERLGRVVDLAGFVEHNVKPSRKQLTDPSFIENVVARLETGKVGVNELERDVGSRDGVWATTEDTLRNPSGPADDADSLRDRLGLDDPVRFGAGKRMVILFYSGDAVPDRALWRPTVLDVGSDISAAAWMPSDGAADPTGFTQDLATGERGGPEVLHRTFPARDIADLSVTGPLTRDPATDYR